MFDRKGRVLLAVFLVLALAIPAIGVFASGAERGAAAPAAPTPLSWTQVHQLPAGQFYYGIYFPTKDVGYAVSGPDWNNANNGRGAPTYVSKTIDGGKSWTSKPIPETDGWARGITCTDANNCWIAGNVKGRIMRTTDGGATWKTITNNSGYSKFLWSIGSTGSGTTILAGTTGYDPTTQDGYVANWLRSTDGEVFKASIGIVGTKTLWVQWDIECPSPGYCYSVGKDYIWRSTNNTANWSRYFIGITGNAYQNRFYGGSCVSNESCWIVGKSPWIRSTNNSGASWSSNAVAGMPAGGQLWDVAMVSPKIGYAVGCSDTQMGYDRCLGTGMVLKTEDGITWLPIAAPGPADMMDIWAFGETDVFVVDWSGKIWHGTGEPEPTPTPTATATPETGRVLGFAFNDLNGDSLHDENEPGLEGAKLLIRRGRTEVATVVSGSDGAFRFDGVTPGAYTVECADAPQGFARSRFLGTFRLRANQEIEVYLGYEAAGPEATSTPTATATVTSQPNAAGTPAYLPVLTH
jgi:photosystem II stability/assembly factor-like uncharacterized protein